MTSDIAHHPAAKPVPLWQLALRLPLAWGELQGFRLMDQAKMAEAGLSQADLDAATLSDFLFRPSDPARV